MRFGFAFILLIISTSLQSQLTYPKNYFRNPLGIPIKLVANFGELRSNHWHMGLDIRTNQTENLPVHAAANGYISHVGIRPQSFGRFIIIKHPNGYSTLYGHLNDFFPALEEYVREQEYQQERWAIELDFAKDKFPVTKGQLIAYSGSTGASQGPHLHFEIRDTKTDRCINPLLFGLPINDNVPPTLVKLAMYDRSRSVYDQTPQFFLIKKTDGGYIIPQSTIKTGFNKLSFAIQAYDRMTGSTNTNGIYATKLSFDEKPQIGFELDSIDYDETQYVNAQVDYKYHHNGGPFIQSLSQLPGDHGIVYRKIDSDGIIYLNDTATHKISIEVKDAYLNTSVLNFFIQHEDGLAKPILSQTNLSRFIPNEVNVLEKPDFEIYLPEYALYDTVQTFYYRSNSTLRNAVSATHQINDPSIPLHLDMTVRVKLTQPVSDEWKDKIIIQRNYQGNTSVRKAEWQTNTGEQWLAAKFDDFGIFQAYADIEPPVINDLGKGDTIDLSASPRIVFQPTDNSKVLRNFRAELDGKWLRFTNDKGWSYIYNFDEHCPFGVHELKVSVEDLVGNMTIKTWWFKRYPYALPKKKIASKKTKVKSKNLKGKKAPPKKK